MLPRRRRYHTSPPPQNKAPKQHTFAPCFSLSHKPLYHSTMEFEKRKASSLVSMASTSTDKSPKGTLDAPIIPLLNSINNHPSYFTTSSCSGRISILSQPFNITTKKKKARGGSWIFITHEPANTSIVTDLLFPTATEKGWGEGEVESELVFRFEPLIIAIECKDLGAAQGLVATAIACGFRESGITSVCKRVIIAIRCSIRLEVPLGLVGNVMVSREYVEYLVGISNEKMQSNRKRTDCFLQVLESKLLCNQVVEAKSGLVNAEGGDGDCGAESTTEVTVGDCNLEKTDLSSHSGSLDLQCRNSLLKIVIVGEPVDKLFLWGHSACTLNNEHYKKVVVFGGFGGQGRHARRNDSLMLDPFSGTLVAVNVEGPPSPRLSHTSSVTGECIFIIGGRGDPLKILNDVWVLDMARNEWSLLECAGSVFHPRHRHAAAVVDGKIYVFGGLDNETVSSSMQVLNTESSRWSDISVQGEWPCARHSHSLVAVGSLLFMFGGYDGEKALGDLYSFDTKTFLWKKEKTTGRTPYPRFSHSMFLYKNYVGIIGGCPVRQHFQEVALLDMRHSSWRHITLDSIGGNMFVRSTASVVDDDLVMIGGGASCYAFGTKFSKPTKLHLLPLTYPDDSHTSTHMEEIPIIHKPKESAGKDLELCTGAEYHVLKLERKYAKMAKDILKQFGWLDLGRKVYSRGNGLHIYLPVTEKFYTLFLEVEHDYRDPSETLNDLNLVGTATSEIFLVNNVSYQIPLNHLFSCGGSLLVDEAVCLRKALKSPHKRLSETVGSLIKQKGLSQKLLEQIPTRFVDITP
ncbi:hypothetical protein GIB67_011502 [Kingdonia uniflora]|uniref:tRNA(Phe) 7-[(3-amino-3-carboxypropyl)-4-demethylwyosine(37)-N(4)]-methyltransferase n=1 Tax=Kingdonia uniflora TaxID=39325 RepID=A0A7J7NLN6_9MAGN|nr:hypothetical protein GIB67_011502 [Kingdonia uniflora]